MEAVHALIAEILANLINTFETADNKSLKIELGSDTHVHIDVQCIEVCDEWLCACSARNILKDRSLDLGIAAVVEELTHSAQNGSTLQECVLDAIVDDKVDIALTGTLLWIVELVISNTILILHDRQWLKALRQKLYALDMNRNLSHLCAEDISLDANNIADVQEFLEHLIIHILIFFNIS